VSFSNYNTLLGANLLKIIKDTCAGKCHKQKPEATAANGFPGSVFFSSIKF